MEIKDQKTEEEEKEKEGEKEEKTKEKKKEDQVGRRKNWKSRCREQSSERTEMTGLTKTRRSHKPVKLATCFTNKSVAPSKSAKQDLAILLVHTVILS